jgi:putative hemolysin
VVLKPITGLISVTVNGILFLCGVRDKEGDTDVTEEEIINMVNEGHEQGVIQDSEAEMISNIFEYGDKEAQDIMTHRKNIIAIDGETGLTDALEFMINERNSRYPVYEENIDHIIGILHLKHAMRFRQEGCHGEGAIKDLEGLLREPYFVPQTKNIDELFKEMQSQKLQMAIVVDEYGQTAGLVAMEDILEEIVGNIMDEYDEDKEYIEDKGNDEYVMDGTTPLEELEERFDIVFEEEEYETLNGFMISKLDRIPEPDEEFDVDYGGYNFKILSVDKKMIKSVLVTKLPEETVDGEEDAVAEQSELEEIAK